jgi:hypothetical protein
MGAAAIYRRSVPTAFSPVPGAAIELLDYAPGQPRTYPGLPGAAALTVWLVCKEDPQGISSQTVFTVGSAGPYPTSLVAFGGNEAALNFGLNTYTEVNDTLDMGVFQGRLRLIEATIYKNDASCFSLLINGVALPHSIKPAGSAMTSRDFGGDIGFGYLLLSRPELDWHGEIAAGYVYAYDMPAGERQQMRTRLRAKFPEVTT